MQEKRVGMMSETWRICLCESIGYGGWPPLGLGFLRRGWYWTHVVILAGICVRHVRSTCGRTAGLEGCGILTEVKNYIRDESFVIFNGQVKEASRAKQIANERIYVE